jgi:hypothetical protein
METAQADPEQGEPEQHDTILFKNNSCYKINSILHIFQSNNTETGECLICMEENKKLNIINHTNEINNKKHKICTTCYYSLKNKNICPFCRQQINHPDY